VALTRRRTRRPRYTVVILILAALTIISLDFSGAFSPILRSIKDGAQDVFAPIQSGVSSAFRPVGNFFDGALHYGSLKAQNAKLREENIRLRSSASESAVLRKQLREISAQEHLTFGPGVPAVMVQVEASSPSNFQDVIVVDKGRNAGIKVGNPVVTGGGLVGRVVDVSHFQSRVLLISDPSSQMGVVFGSQGYDAIASGQGAGHDLTVSGVFPNETVTPHEEMVTAGVANDIYPKDLPIGTVSSVSWHPGELQQRVTLAPFVDLSHLDVVSVLRWTPTPSS
jgi:rod shape-determining protein MreC